MLDAGHEANFRADAELRGKWVLRKEPALVDSTSPRYGERASYYSAVCLEIGGWRGWIWRGTATQEHRPPSRDNCVRGTAGG